MSAPISVFDVMPIRQDFPILTRNIGEKPLVYLDNAATTQKPRAVIDAIKHCYSHEYASVHRGIHTLSEQMTEAFEAVRAKVQRFIHASASHEIIFVRGTTEAINLVAQCYGRSHLQAGDEILVSEMEHHANIVPWQMLCQQIGTILRVIPINDAGEILLNDYQRLLNPRTKLIAITHLSNVLGTINPIQQMITLAHQNNTPVLIDGAQAAPHLAIDVQALDCDFYTFSGHKLYAPSGIGILYGKSALLNTMPPYHGGGAMISRVSFQETHYANLPYKFEAGTPNIAGVIGLGAAIDYLERLGLNNIGHYENELLHHAIHAMRDIPGLRMIGTAKHKASVFSFILDKIHPHDIGTILNHEGIAIRSGHHCAMPLMERFGLPATARASFSFYNTREEINLLVAALYKVQEVFR